MRKAIAVVVALTAACTRNVTQYNCETCTKELGCSYSIPDVDIDAQQSVELARWVDCLQHPTADPIETCARQTDRATTRCSPTTISRDVFFTKTVTVSACGVCLPGPPKRCGYALNEFGDDQYAKSEAQRNLCGEDASCNSKRLYEFETTCRQLPRSQSSHLVVTH